MPLTLDILHADHGIGESHRDVISKLFEEAGDGFLLKTVELPSECPDLLSAINGPIVGDPPVPSAEVFWTRRGTRRNLSRMCNRPMRPTRLMTIVGAREGENVKIYTAYGGPCAPREITDVSLPSKEVEVSAQFWAQHALSA